MCSWNGSWTVEKNEVNRGSWLQGGTFDLPVVCDSGGRTQRFAYSTKHLKIESPSQFDIVILIVLSAVFWDGTRNSTARCSNRLITLMLGHFLPKSLLCSPHSNPRHCKIEVLAFLAATRCIAILSFGLFCPMRCARKLTCVHPKKVMGTHLPLLLRCTTLR